MTNAIPTHEEIKAVKSYNDFIKLIDLNRMEFFTSDNRYGFYCRLAFTDGDKRLYLNFDANLHDKCKPRLEAHWMSDYCIKRDCWTKNLGSAIVRFENRRGAKRFFELLEEMGNKYRGFPTRSLNLFKRSGGWRHSH